MSKMCIYEPALCCETGLCGVKVDPELLRISTVLNTLKNEGVEIERFNLNSAPMEFVKNNIVNQYLNDKGIEGLPVVTLDGEIVIEGRYPANDEILTLLKLPAEMLLPKGATSCCCGDDDDTCCSGDDDDTCCCGDDDDTCCCGDGEDKEVSKNDKKEGGCSCGCC